MLQSLLTSIQNHHNPAGLFSALMFLGMFAVVCAGAIAASAFVIVRDAFPRRRRSRVYSRRRSGFRW